MKNITIALYYPSTVIVAGLSEIFSHMREYPLSVSVIGRKQLGEYIRHNSPDIVICDPVAAASEIASVISDTDITRPTMVALTATLLPQTLLADYDVTLSLYDEAEAFESLIKKTVVDDAEDERQKELSPREKDVVIGIVKGLSNKEIASEMNVSTNTVMTHRRNIASKLQIHSVAGLTIYAIVSKLVKIEDLQQS